MKPTRRLQDLRRIRRAQIFLVLWSPTWAVYAGYRAAGALPDGRVLVASLWLITAAVHTGFLRFVVRDWPGTSRELAEVRALQDEELRRSRD